jgi:pimeloyl-ACP methyl ester carboxylesterase
MRIEVKTVKTETFSMEWFSFGRGEKTMVILPGLSVQSVMGLASFVAEAYRMFADDHTVYMFDRRKELPASYSIKEMAADTAEAMRELGLSGVDLFGASQGGMIAMQIAIDHPELVHKLVLCSTSSAVDEEQFRAAMEMENPTIESIEDIAFRKQQKSEEENKTAHENNAKAEEEEKLRREELAKRMANGEDLSEDVLRDVFEKRFTAKADKEDSDNDEESSEK